MDKSSQNGDLDVSKMYVNMYHFQGKFSALIELGKCGICFCFIVLAIFYPKNYFFAVARKLILLKFYDI